MSSKITSGYLTTIPGPKKNTRRADLGHPSLHFFLGRQLEDCGTLTTMPHVQYQNSGLTSCVLSQKGGSSWRGTLSLQYIGRRVMWFSNIGRSCSLMRRSVALKFNLRMKRMIKHRKLSISGCGVPRAFCLYGRNLKTRLFRVSWRHRQSSRQQLIGMNISFCLEARGHHIQHHVIHSNACLRFTFDVVITQMLAFHWPTGIQRSTVGIYYLSCLTNLLIRTVTNGGRPHQKAWHIIRNIVIQTKIWS